MARILEFDLESTPNLGWAYGRWDTRLIRIDKYSSIMSFSWRWYGEEEIHHLSWANVARKKGTSANKALIIALWDLFNEADVVMAHNAYRFDIPMAKAAFIYHGLTPPSPYKVIDTLRIARKEFKFPGGNGLNDLGLYLNVGVKIEKGYGELWYKCLQGDKKAWEDLETYNNQDIELMEAVYEKMRPYASNHVNLADIEQIDGACPKCLSTNLQRRGFNVRRNGQTQRYQCMNCGGWTNEAKLNKEGRLVNA